MFTCGLCDRAHISSTFLGAVRPLMRPAVLRRFSFSFCGSLIVYNVNIHSVKTLPNFSCRNIKHHRDACRHGRQRSKCKDCGGIGICEHGRQRRYWKDCGGKECGVWSYESTSMEDLVGYSCGVCKVRECVCQPGGAELTRPPAGPGSTRGRASLDPRVARVRHSL